MMTVPAIHEVSVNSLYAELKVNPYDTVQKEYIECMNMNWIMSITHFSTVILHLVLMTINHTYIRYRIYKLSRNESFLHS